MKRYLLNYTLIMALLFIMVGCADEHHSHRAKSDDRGDTLYTEIWVHNTRYDIFNTPDGTQCIASYVKETITCNWKNESSSSPSGY